MAADRVRDPIPRRWRFPLLGVAIAFIAPLGWFILQIPHQGLWSWPEVKVELANHALLYGYMTLGSGLCFAIAGYLLGRAFDAIVREQREAAAQATLMEGLNLRLEAISVTDELTGMYNRRYFFERLAEYLRAARRHRLPLSLMMIDIDHFKRVNDTYGHPAGDRVLRTIAELIRSGLRASDISARYGGEEFVILLPYTDETEALRLAHRLLTTVSSHPFALPPEAGPITISIGLSRLDVEHPVSGEALIARADGALYQAKHGGRNRVALADAAAETEAAHLTGE
ncbi:MAG: GGDEF domain-containing protein [Nitrospirae bacterium CG18_big_fil_WC_8_21_14_2_50_70_55]|nr:GGDEF domain-containing protein [Deltaproteobacteria bacterium]OIP65047.1 MAG: hypothetical protein AUK30_05390 [Nitrospirae bacterium CG2_30_70_394]PIQ04333.1 MAG: GGDEF domain-containing protein [Nitrospirae bacterium CG18_big_fil_WC_8_21_14_2_50_70_55]PIU79072.1 MAG: GGDEF domain-containing protein [Nitrospirae bacterium CG06_land_8_20_14_3_00_70_43]PIW82436.1 MAG: GGDEF domain-containing protein [Nitrospirae bacterium CG_4_8_14_3_um_filter_70_85]PIX82117.1 MAG: GGDEF domain-containing p